MERNQLQTQSFVTEREWTVDGIPVLTATVTLPQPVEAADAAARRIRRFYRLQGRCYLRYCERFLLPQAAEAYRAALAVSAPLPCFRAELNYRITYNDGRLWSLYTQSRESAPSGTLLARRGDTWDLRSGYPAPLSSFFPPRSHWKQQLLNHAAQEIERQERAGIARYHDGWRHLLRRRFDPRNFYLTEDGLAFFFPMHAIAPPAESIPTFLLPYNGGAPVPRT